MQFTLIKQRLTWKLMYVFCGNSRAITARLHQKQGWSYTTHREGLISSDNVVLTSLSKVPHGQEEDDGHSMIWETILGNGWEWQIVDEATYQREAEWWVNCSQNLTTPHNSGVTITHTASMWEGPHLAFFILQTLIQQFPNNSRADICIKFSFVVTFRKKMILVHSHRKAHEKWPTYVQINMSPMQRQCQQ